MQETLWQTRLGALSALFLNTIRIGLCDAGAAFKLGFAWREKYKERTLEEA